MAFPVPDPELPLFDHEHLENLFGKGDGLPPEMVEELYNLFEPENAARLEELEPQARAGDTAALLRGFHFIAGSAANLGLRRLSELARAHENAMEAGADNRLPERVADLRAVFDDTRQAFREAYGPA